MGGHMARVGAFRTHSCDGMGAWLSHCHSHPQSGDMAPKQLVLHPHTCTWHRKPHTAADLRHTKTPTR